LAPLHVSFVPFADIPGLAHSKTLVNGTATARAYVLGGSQDLILINIKRAVLAN
jgi:hypothetical protein